MSDSDSLSSADKADADALLAAATGIAPSQSSTNGYPSTVAAPAYYVMPAPAPVVMPAPAPMVPVYAKPVHPWAYQHLRLYNLIQVTAGRPHGCHQPPTRPPRPGGPG